MDSMLYASPTRDSPSLSELCADTLVVVSDLV